MALHKCWSCIPSRFILGKDGVCPCTNQSRTISHWYMCLTTGTKVFSDASSENPKPIEHRIVAKGTAIHLKKGTAIHLCSRLENAAATSWYKPPQLLLRPPTRFYIRLVSWKLCGSSGVHRRSYTGLHWSWTEGVPNFQRCPCVSSHTNIWNRNLLVNFKPNRIFRYRHSLDATHNAASLLSLLRPSS
jgi:hypothetical protein